MLRCLLFSLLPEPVQPTKEMSHDALRNAGNDGSTYAKECIDCQIKASISRQAKCETDDLVGFSKAP